MSFHLCMQIEQNMLERFFMHTDADVLRYQAIERILLQSSHPLLPRIRSREHAVCETRPCMDVYTHTLPDEILLSDVEFGKLTPGEVISLLDSFCTLLGVLAVAGAAHGTIHETSLYFSPTTRRFVLRQFASETADIRTSDVHMFILMALRMCAARGMHLRISPHRCTLQMITEAVAAMRSMHENRLARSVQLERESLPYMLMSSGRVQPFAISPVRANAHNEIVYAVNLTITQEGLCLPLFVYANSPASGFGPTRQIINDFFNALLQAGALEYRTPSPLTSAYAWPTLPSSARPGLQTRTFYTVLGNLIVYSRLMNFATDVVFSPVLLRLLLIRSQDAARAGTPTAHDREIIRPLLNAIALMNSGAHKYAQFVREHAVMPELLCEAPETPTTAESVLGAVDFAPDVTAHRIATFRQWISMLSRDDLRRFLRLVTGGCSLVRGVDRIRVMTPKGETHLRVSVCAREICIPETALDNCETCTAVFAAELHGNDDFNDK